MNLLKLDPAGELKEMFIRLASPFRRYLEPAVPYHGMTTLPDWRLSVDISETNAEYRISGDIPGVRQEDVIISIQDGMLIMQGERRMEQAEIGRNFHRMERQCGYFVRSFKIPDDADASALRTEFKDGMFNLMLPKFAMTA